MNKEKIKIKYNNNLINFIYNEQGKGYVGNKEVREMWYYPDDGALYIWSISGWWKKINKKEFELIDN